MSLAVVVPKLSTGGRDLLQVGQCLSLLFLANLLFREAVDLVFSVLWQSNLKEKMEVGISRILRNVEQNLNDGRRNKLGGHFYDGVDSPLGFSVRSLVPVYGK